MYPPQKTIERAKELRRKLTLPEVVLWQAIRGRKLGGVRFRRQHPIGRYILDFYCEEARLAVEVDGQGHEHPDQMAHDARRTAWLKLSGISVYRLAARDVLGNLDGVLAGIRQRVCGEPLHRFAVPLPRWGRNSLHCAQALSNERGRILCYAFEMFSILAYPKLIERALKDAAWTAKHGTREEKSGKFLPPPGWKGRLITATDDGLSAPKRARRLNPPTTDPDVAAC